MGRQILLCDLNVKTEDGLPKHEIYRNQKTLLKQSSETGWSLSNYANCGNYRNSGHCFSNGGNNE